MKVVSLFDGISCGRVALERQGFNVDYYASEIDKHAIEISDKHGYSMRLGDVRSVGYIPNVDLLIGGSPCQDLSIAKKGRKGLDGDRSGLFWEYVRILKLLNPKWFILENVNSMSKADRDIITREMGVQPVMIDAALVSAQSRKRLFWTNIDVVGLPIDRGIRVKDILEPDAEEDERMLTDKGKAYCLTATYSHVNSTEAGIKNSVERGQRTQVKFTSSGGGLIQVGHIGNTNHQGNRVYSDEGKAPTLTKGSSVGGAVPIKIGRDIGRRLNEDGHRADHDKTIPIERRIETREDDKSGTLTSVMKDNVVVNTETTKIRKLTPVECERLQGLPDNYTEGVSTTNRYRCLGNAFNVDVIAFILSFIPKVQVEA
jgi:DNA (cytosine-5)-methyltransferase 3A